jgi:hypothetical protein
MMHARLFMIPLQGINGRWTDRDGGLLVVGWNGPGTKVLRAHTNYLTPYGVLSGVLSFV